MKNKVTQAKAKIRKQPIINIEETEALLRKKTDFDTNSYLSYMGRMLEQDNQSRFFEGFESLKSDADQYCLNHYSSDFAGYLRSKAGSSLYEKYNTMLTMISIEKYSPFSSKEKLQDIFREIEGVYKQL